MPPQADNSLTVSQSTLIPIDGDLAKLDSSQIVQEIEKAVGKFCLLEQPKTHLKLDRLKAQLQEEFGSIISTLLQCNLKHHFMSTALSCLLNADKSRYYEISEGPLAQAVEKILEDREGNPAVSALLNQVGFLSKLKLYSYLPSIRLIRILRQMSGNIPEDTEDVEYPVENDGDYGINIDAISASTSGQIYSGYPMQYQRLDIESEVMEISSILEERVNEGHLTKKETKALLALLENFPNLKEHLSVDMYE